jgi:hypothetical protein
MLEVHVLQTEGAVPVADTSLLASGLEHIGILCKPLELTTENVSGSKTRPTNGRI